MNSLHRSCRLPFSKIHNSFRRWQDLQLRQPDVLGSLRFGPWRWPLDERHAASDVLFLVCCSMHYVFVAIIGGSMTQG